jgi:hypothetical protein
MSDTPETHINIAGDSKPFKVSILRGNPKDREPDDEPTEYAFATGSRARIISVWR